MFYEYIKEFYENVPTLKLIFNANHGNNRLRLSTLRRVCGSYNVHTYVHAQTFHSIESAISFMILIYISFLMTLFLQYIAEVKLQ